MVSNPKSLFESVDAPIFTPQSRSVNTFMRELSHESVNASKTFSQLCGANACKTASSQMSPLKHPHPLAVAPSRETVATENQGAFSTVLRTVH